MDHSATGSGQSQNQRREPGFSVGPKGDGTQKSLPTYNDQQTSYSECISRNMLIILQRLTLLNVVQWAQFRSSISSRVMRPDLTNPTSIIYLSALNDIVLYLVTYEPQ